VYEAPSVKIGARKSTNFASVNFDDDDDVFDEEAEETRVSHLNESTIDVSVNFGDDDVFDKEVKEAGVAHLNESTIDASTSGRVSRHLEECVPLVSCFRHELLLFESRLEGVNRAKLKFTKLITTTSRVSVRNISESEREGEKQIASK
jgi:hypothetical protein